MRGLKDAFLWRSSSAWPQSILSRENSGEWWEMWGKLFGVLGSSWRNGSVVVVRCRTIPNNTLRRIWEDFMVNSFWCVCVCLYTQRFEHESIQMKITRTSCPYIHCVSPNCTQPQDPQRLLFGTKEICWYHMLGEALQTQWGRFGFGMWEMNSHKKTQGWIIVKIWKGPKSQIYSSLWVQTQST